MKSLLDEIKLFFGFIDEKKTIEEAPELQEKTPFKGSLVNAQSARPFASSEIKVLEPKIYEDSLNIAAYLRANKPVVVNLKSLDKQAGKRLIDFICGTAYAINGHMMKIGDHIFLFTPANVNIDNSEEKTSFEQGVEESEKEMFFKQAAVK